MEGGQRRGSAASKVWATIYRYPRWRSLLNAGDAFCRGQGLFGAGCDSFGNAAGNVGQRAARAAFNW